MSSAELDRITLMQFSLRAVEEREGIGETWTRNCSFNCLLKTSSSGQTTTRSQSTKSADEAPYCHMSLSQLQKMSKWAILPCSSSKNTQQARATNLKRMPKLQPWNYQSYAPCRGRRLHKQQPSPTNQWLTTIQNTHIAPTKMLGNGRQDQALQKRSWGGLLVDPWPKTDRLPERQEAGVMQEKTNPEHPYTVYSRDPESCCVSVQN